MSTNRLVVLCTFRQPTSIRYIRLDKKKCETPSRVNFYMNLLELLPYLLPACARLATSSLSLSLWTIWFSPFLMLFIVRPDPIDRPFFNLIIPSIIMSLTTDHWCLLSDCGAVDAENWHVQHSKLTHAQSLSHRFGFHFFRFFFN